MLARTATALTRPSAAAATEHDLHIRHHGTSQGSATQRADLGADHRGGAAARADLWPEAKRAGAAAGAALPFRAEFIWLAFGASRPRPGADAAVRSGGVSAADRGREDRHHFHGADHVHPAAQAAGGGEPKIRHLLAAPCRSCPSTLPYRGQARDDRMVGARDL